MTTQTNVHDIDEVIALAIKNDPYKKRGDISVTTLIKPPQMVALEKIHEGEIEEDVSEGLWRLLGSAVHVVLQQAAEGREGWVVEKALEMECRGWKVSGTPDLWRPVRLPTEDHGREGELVDFKVTSAWSFLLENTGVKPEWEQQLNLYALMLTEAGVPVTRLTIMAILRDWMKSKALQDRDYPQIPFKQVNVPLWSVDRQRQFLNERVMLHQAAQNGQGYPGCTDEERWAKPEKHAAMKRGRKGAVKLFDDKIESQVWMRDNKRDGETLYYEHRPGAQTRCESYCPVMKWCDQAKALGVTS